MRIGLITWFGGENYGTSLQAIALYKAIEELGHEAELISFQVGNKYHINHKDTFGEYVYSGMGVLYKKLLAGNRRKALEASLADREQLVRQVCQVTHDVSGEDAFVGIANTYDLLLCGSDQIWNPKWYHANYYAAYPEITVPKCSYASSIGLKEYNAGQNQEWERAVCGFDKVSSREAAGCAILGNILHQNVPQVMDPVFLHTREFWHGFAGKDAVTSQTKDALCYFLSDRKRHWKSVRDFADERGYYLSVIPMQGHSYQQPGKILYGTGLRDFVEQIQNAQVILTDSFHAVVFSIIFRKEFYVFEKQKECTGESQNARIQELLELCGLKNRLVAYDSNRIPVQESIDYHRVEAILEEKIDLSKQYLSDILMKRGL